MKRIIDGYRCEVYKVKAGWVYSRRPKDEKTPYRYGKQTSMFAWETKRQALASLEYLINFFRKDEGKEEIELVKDKKEFIQTWEKWEVEE